MIKAAFRKVCGYRKSGNIQEKYRKNVQNRPVNRQRGRKRKTKAAQREKKLSAYRKGPP